MKHKLLRVLVAVILVCCLVVSWSPIQVKANTLAMAGSAILSFFEAGAAAAGMSVFGYVAMGLGITLGAGALAVAVGEYIEYSGNEGAKIYYYPDGTWSYGVDLGFVESVRAFFFDSGYVLDASQMVTTVPEGVEFGSFTPRVPCVGYQYSYHSVLDSGYRVNSLGYLLSTVPNDPYVISATSAETTYITVNGNKHYFKMVASGQRTYTEAEFVVFLSKSSKYHHLGEMKSVDAALRNVFKIYGWTGIAGSGDVAIDYVPPLAVPMTEAYPEWYGNSRPYVTPGTEEEVAVLPVPYNPTADPDAAPGVLTQPDIWGGSIADPIPGIGTGSDTTISVTPWETFKTWISTGWQSIIQAIPTAGTIADAIGNVIKSIFIPDADFISEKWNAIRSRFDFADSITATGEVLVNILDGLDPEPPVIYIDLGAAEGSYNIGGEVPFIDLRWYAQYKPTMDMIVSAFLWLAFVWRLILKLPGIISGMPGEFVLMNLPVNLPHLGIGSGQRREELESGRNNRRLGDGH